MRGNFAQVALVSCHLAVGAGEHETSEAHSALALIAHLYYARSGIGGSCVSSKILTAVAKSFKMLHYSSTLSGLKFVNSKARLDEFDEEVEVSGSYDPKFASIATFMQGVAFHPVLLVLNVCIQGLIWGLRNDSYQSACLSMS